VSIGGEASDCQSPAINGVLGNEARPWYVERYLFMEAITTDARFLTSIKLLSTEPNSRKKREIQPTHARSHRIDSVRDS